MATTCSPTASSPPGQAATTPVASMPGTRGKLTSGSARPSRVFSSERFRPKALTSMRTQPGSGRGTGRSRTTSASGGAGTASRTTARMEEGRGAMCSSVTHAHSEESSSRESASARCASVGVAMADLPPLFADLVRLEIELWDAVEARLRADLGVGLATAQTLAVVAGTPECRVQDIVRDLSITVGGASKTVDRLERSGLVARRPHPTDRRSSVIALTPAGTKLHAKAERLVARELDARIGAAISERGFDQLHGAIVALRARL